jgi:hypothetical protein
VDLIYDMAKYFATWIRLQFQNTNYFLLEVFMGENGGSKLNP